MSRTTWFAGLLAALPAVVAAGVARPTPDGPGGQPPGPKAPAVDATTLRGKVLCGYQGWFRCPGDPAREGWRHWSRDARRIGPDTLTFDLWPDLSEYADDEKYPAPGFRHADGKPAHLFSSANPKTVRRHFRWMQRYGIDGVWLQHFLVDLPGGPQADRYPSRLRVLRHVRDAADRTGRVWALSYDTSGMPADRIYDVLTVDWKKRVDDGTTAGPCYLHEGGRPVVQVWGFYRNHAANPMSAALARRLVAFFHAGGKYAAYLVGGGDWDWRKDPAWQEIILQLDAYAPWNVGNYWTDRQGVRHATTDYWAEDKRACDRRRVLWLPVVYPGFSWDNLKGKPPGTTTIPRRGGRFLWEQFHELARLGARGVYVAMFDEVDEGTAVFKVSNDPPRPGRFVTYEGLPADWYLRLVGEGAKVVRGERPSPKALPIQP